MRIVTWMDGTGKGPKPARTTIDMLSQFRHARITDGKYAAPHPHARPVMNAPDLVLLHGALGSSNQLDPLADALCSRFLVHQLDFEGHAGAAFRGRPYRVPLFVENVIELLDGRGIQRANLFGHSMGGYVALVLALQHPDRVERVATLGTKFRWDTNNSTREAARLDPATIRARVPHFAASLEARHAHAGGWESVLSRTADFLRDLGARPILTDAALRQIRKPVRIIVGDRDNTVGIPESTEVAHALHDAIVTVLPDTPHPLEQVDVQALAPVLLEFFSGRGAPASASS